MLEELDYDVGVHNSQDADKNLAVRFYLHPVQDDDASLQQGRPIFVDKEFVEIRIRGDRNNVVQRACREDDKRRFSGPYKDFKTGEESSITGTPLKEWPSMTKSMIEELRYMGFFTVEQLASASDTVCSKFAGLQSYKQRAINFIAYAKDQKPLDQLQAVADDAKNRAETLQRQLAEQSEQMRTMAAQIEALQKKK